jgi:hypothetical protein
MVFHDDVDLCEFEIGDLVRLNEDVELEVGCGLVTDIKTNFDDVYDLKFLDERIRNFREILARRDDDFLPSKPQILVLWSGKNITSSNISIWMYSSELTLVQKVVKVTK